MKLIHTIALASLMAILSGCSTMKAFKYIKSGTVSRSAFKTEVAFEMRFGLIILKVMIHGKEYSFILDTGAPTVISNELAQELGIKPAGKGKARDSQGASSSLGFAAIDSIGIGDLQFLNTGAAIADLHQSSEIACFHVDGLIGANLMRKAVWQFDYERHIITITSSRDSLTIPSNAQIIKFRQARTGTPLMDVQLNGQTDHNVTIDLGSTGDFVSSVATLELLKKDGLSTNTYSYGAGTSGLYGHGKDDTTWYAVIHSIGIDSLKLTNQVVSFTTKAVKTIGTNFFKNYRLIFDWSANELTMIPVHAYDNTLHKSYRFTPILKDHKVFVGSVYHTGNGDATGPQLGDQVLEIDGKDYRTCSGDNWCALLSERLDTSISTTSLLIRSGEKELKFTVSKEALFLKK